MQPTAPPVRPPTTEQRSRQQWDFSDPVIGMTVLLGINQLGQLLTRISGLPIPGAVVGLLLLWGLISHSKTLQQTVAPSAGLLVRCLPLFIIPAGVGAFHLPINQHWSHFTLVCLVAWIGALTITALGVNRMLRTHQGVET